jgi:hypothetical protein
MSSATKKATVGDQSYDEVIDYERHFKNKLDYFNKQGWGYSDSEFILDKKSGHVKFTGDRYLYSGFELPGLKDFALTEVGISFDRQK